MKFTGMSRTIRCLIAMMAVCLVMLCGVAVAESTSDFTISDGVLTKYNGSDQIVTVPDGVTSIGADAFSNSHILSKVTLPDTVTSIGDSAFGSCYYLPSIILPDGITSIGQDAFYDRITVYCNENTTTEQTLTEAGYSYQIYQPIAVTYADNGDGTATITGLTGVGDELIIPSTIDGLKVTTIGKSAFRYNTELTSVVIPEGVTKIESGAFNGCRLIQSMTLPSTLVTIEGSAFMNCYQIAELKIPAATTDIYAGAFRGSPIPLVIDGANTAYTVVDGVLYTADRKILKFCPDSKTGVFAIPEGTEEVESGAFFACNSVTELHIPASVTTIPAYSFYPMGALNDFVVDEASESYQAVDGMLLTKDGKILIVGCDAQNGKVTIPDGVEEIWPQALVSSRITELVLPEGVITINTRAIDASQLEKVNLPGSLTSIDSNAFSGMRSSLVATVEDGSYAHQWCIDNDVTVEVVSKVTDPAFFTYTNNGDGTCTITGYSGTVADVIIPGIINGLQVTAIDEAFEENTVLTSVVIPEGVTRIGWDAFLDCSNLKSVTLPSTLVTIEGYVFGCCSSLTELAIPAATTDIHERAIYGAPTVITVDEANPAYVVVEGMLYTADRKTLKFCPTTKAGVLTIPEGTETIETMVFENCHNLTEIRIPASVSSISNGRMNLLKSFVIAETNTTYQAVDGMLLSKDGKSLVAVPLARFADTGVITVPDGVQRIIRSAIRGALEEIKELVLPEGITTLDTGAVDARYLEKVNLPASLNELTPYSFTDRNEDFTATVEQASYAHQWCIENGVKVEVVYPFTYTDNGDGTATITGLTGTAADLVIPTTIDGLKVTAIGAKAFRFNTEITSVVIPEGVTKIGSGAFNGCRNIQSVSLPSTLVTIESSAFTNCYQITELTIPAATTDIRSGAFWGSSISLKIDSANTAYKVVDDVLYTADLKTLKFCPINKTGVFAIPAGTEEIEASAFMACNDVTEVQIPASVTAIDGNVFYPMGMLKNFVVDEASESYQAVDGMLLTKDGKLLIAGCDSLEGTVTIPDGVKEIGLQALMSGDITELVLPEGITTIEMLAVNASELEKVNLPGSLTSIDSNAFSGMRSSLVATVEDGSYAHQWCIDNDVTVEVVSKTTDPAAFTYTDNGDGTCTITGYTGTAAEVIIPAKMDGLTVTVIGLAAFEQNETITSVVIPEGVTHIEIGAFYLCRNLQSVSLPESLTTIGGVAFAYCSSLTELTIPAATTSIGSAFYGMPTIITVDSANTAYKTVDDLLYTIDGKMLMFCPNTKTGVFSIPEGTEAIGEFAFFFCEKLTELRIPASLKTIPSAAFYKTSSLNGFVVDENNTTYKAVNGMLLSRDSTRLYIVPQTFSGKITIPDGVTTICYESLRDSQPGIIELVLPDSVTTIEDFAIGHNALEKINLPAGLTSMGYNAIYNRSENLVATVEDGSYAHQWCIDNDVTVEVVSKTTDPAAFTYNDNGDGTAAITGYTGTSAAVSIPASIDGLNVTAIGDSAFENNTTITSVIIPEGVTSIGQYAFWQCRSLQSVSLPETLTTIEDYAFSFCFNLTELRIPAAATSIGSAFYGMPTIITVDSANTAYKTVDDVLYTIDGKTLMFCPRIKEGAFSIPQGTETIGDSAFFACWNLTEISIPASVTTIPGDAFGEANKLTGFVVDENNTAYKAVNGMLLSKDGTLLHTVPMTFSGTVTVPESVTTIGNCAFRGSWPAGVTEIVLPDSVAVLEHEAFLNQTALEKINLPAGLTSISDGAFYNLNSECVATVYENTLAHRWCVEKGIKVNVLESDGLIFPVAASRLCTNPETPAGCYFASVQKANGELRLQFDNDACLWDDLVTSAVYEDGTMMLPVDVLRLSGAAAYRWMEGDPESETILDQLAQASAQTLGEYDEQIYLSIPYAQYDEANQTVSPVASENAFLIQWLDGNGEIMLTESVTMIITHSDLSSRSAQIRYFDMSTAIPNYHNVEGVTSRVENNTLIYSVPADYEELISTRYPAIEGAAFARPTCFGWSARLPLSDGNTYWSWRMSGVELPFVDESAILWFDENDYYLGCERISVRYEVKTEEQLIPSMPASRIFPDDLPFGMEATVTVADGKFGVHIDDEATNWNDVFTFLEGMPWHNPDTGESGVWSDEVMIGARMTDLDGAVYSKSVVGNVWESDEEILASLESSDDVQDLTTYGHGWWHDVVVLDRDSGSISLSEIISDPDFGGDYTYAVQWFDADMNVIATEKVVYEITHTNPENTYNYSRTLIPAENIVANVENASGVTSTVKDGSVSYKQIAEDAVIVTEIIAPENAVTYSAPGECFDSDAERWPVDNGKIGYVREGVLMDTVTASDFICWYDADGELIGGGWIDFRYERGEEAEILPMAAERIAVQGGAFGLEVDVEITDGMMHAVFDDEATNWNDVFTFLEPTPWYNPETSEKGVRFGAYFYIPEGAVYAKHIVVETEDTDEEILAYLAEEAELATLNANMRFGSYYFPAELNNGVITLNDYHTNVQVFQWLDEDQNVLFTEKAVLCFEHTNPNQTYNYSRTLIPAQNIVGNAENMPGVTWKAADGLIVTTVEDKQITTTTEIIAPENAATYSMPELDTNGERWELYNGRVGFQRVGWPSTENQKSTEYLLCWYDADGDLIGGGWITMTDVCPIPETVLPAFTKEIAEEAFADSGVQRVIIPDGCTTIGARAFANCASLTEVHIPASVTSIAEDAFVGCPNLMIYAPMPSTGANFASDHDIKWANVSSFH